MNVNTNAMIDKQLLKLALKHKEHNTVAYLMEQLAGQYRERMIKGSGKLFLYFYPQLPNEALEKLASITEFREVQAMCASTISRTRQVHPALAI